jgi:LacI family transcriptional regulator
MHQDFHVDDRFSSGASKANRPTIEDIAREAGLSTAKVDRVLNARKDTARRAYEAARLVGYHAAPLIGQRVQTDMPRLQLAAILHEERQAFYQSF